FIILRLSELLETVFFVLRKKFKQVSMLHVYHHISTVVLLWIFLLYSGGMMEWFIGALNSAMLNAGFLISMFVRFYVNSYITNKSERTAFYDPYLQKLQTTFDVTDYKVAYD
ncbi:very long chain fatty acid elongase F-like, partial [Chironomus tepperi]|uniref:very long chain fatty acid elongase F-like n=1 Tax=Chironomus tepperi TaxID=113505 RepID=UPI00391F80D9